MERSRHLKVLSLKERVRAFRERHKPRGRASCRVASRRDDIATRTRMNYQLRLGLVAGKAAAGGMAEWRKVKLSLDVRG